MSDISIMTWQINYIRFGGQNPSPTTFLSRNIGIRIIFLFPEPVRSFGGGLQQSFPEIIFHSSTVHQFPSTPHIIILVALPPASTTTRLSYPSEFSQEQEYSFPRAFSSITYITSTHISLLQHGRLLHSTTGKLYNICYNKKKLVASCFAQHV